MSESNPKAVVLGVDGLMPELVERFVAEGVLPHIARLLERGTATRLMPYISTWGDTNFVTMLTGQAPGTSWIGQRTSPRGTQHLLESMAEAGRRTAFVHFPESLVPEGARDLCFAPFWSAAGPAPMEIVAPALHTTAPDADTPSPDQALGWPPSGATLAHHKKHNRRPIEREGNRFTAYLEPHTGAAERIELAAADPDTAILSAAGHEVRLVAGEWSRWLSLAAADMAGSVRFKLMAFDPANGRVELLQSQVTAPAETADDPALATELVDRHGPFISKWAITCSPDEPGYETSFEEGAYQLNWLIDAATTLLNEHDFSLFATVFRLNDETHHTCLAQCDPASVFYDAARAEHYLDTIRRAYQVLDDGVGRLLAECDDDTLVALVSDHGDVPNRYFCDIHRRLAAFDLVALDTSGQPVVAESRAWLKNERGGLEIFVNLAGRDPDGIVAEADYADVQTRILEALNSWTHETPEGRRPVTALALAKRDAAMIGYWGEHAGDVIFAYDLGFVWGSNRTGDTVAAVDEPGANHGPQVPSARTAFSSNEGLAILQGPGVAAHDALARRPGRYRMDDIGATLAAYFGVASTTRLDGCPLPGSHP